MRNKLVLICTSLGLALAVYVVLLFEPRNGATCQVVNVLGVQQGNRGREYFILEMASDKTKRLVGRFNRPFSKDYIGPAVLQTSTGVWSHFEHDEMAADCKEFVQPHG